MPEETHTVPVVVQADSFSVKEVYRELKQDLMKRLDKQDTTLDRIDRRLDSTATKEDIRQIHERIDGVEKRFEERLVPLEQSAADERAVSQSRGRFRANLAWTIGIAGTCSLIASVVMNLIH